jgi:hypothetical protein
MKIDILIDFSVVFLLCGKGNIIEISMSKIKNNREIMKNCIENGRWGGEFSGNPHSKGEFFFSVGCIILLIIIEMMGRAVVIIKVVVIITVIFMFYLFFLIGNQ